MSSTYDRSTPARNTIHAIIAAYTAAFPDRLRAVYVDGSHADGSDLATSDLDLTIVLKGAFRGEEERAAIERLSAELARTATVELDVGVVDEAELRQQGMHPTLKLASALVWGEDIRDRFAIMPIARWTRDRTHAAYWLTILLYDRPVPVRPPLDYPDARDEFFGYARRLVRLQDGREVPCTRDLIRSTGWAATALLAWKKGVYVTRKRDCHALYRQHIGDQWSDLLTEIYDDCRTRWGYLIPDDATERARLRAICARTLAFENHVLAGYRRFLLDELRAGDVDGRAEAVKVQGRLPLEDAEVTMALANPTPA
ncbi:MAG TPA: nucleotidyltransferase domain-containing protein [Ktedonobacterales bacterium]|nr:nucleotidyltransferase domain-containing protein [Ktedonobacterales bacterium]